jgi:hypothetical protein
MYEDLALQLIRERENQKIVQDYSLALQRGLKAWAQDGCKGPVWENFVIPECERAGLV